MRQIILEAQNPLDLRPEELEGLAQRIRVLDEEYAVEITPEADVDPRRRAVTFWEVLSINIPWIVHGGTRLALKISAKIAEKAVEKVTDKTAEAVVDGVIETAGDWVRERRAEPDSPQRPLSVTIYGADGRVLTCVKYEGPEYEPEEEETP